MAIHWKIPFVSLRSGTNYTVNIYDPNFSGTAVVLKGGTNPFTTDEDGSDDQFTPIRTQSGYFRIIDDGTDASGAAFNWKTMLPSTDTDRPVTLTDGNGNVCWAGFMQSQTFSGLLYGNPQEREFPVICPLSVLAGENVNFDRGLKNFAFLLKEVCDVIDVQSGGYRNSQDTVTTNGAVHIDSVYVQGGPDATVWLNNKVDWQNFGETDSDGTMRSKYSLYEVLEDMCRFWGWTARVCGTTLYLTCSDDSNEQTYLTLNRTQLDTKATQNGDTVSGGSYSPQTVTLADSSANPIFANTDQNDCKIQGPHRAVVKADCNKHEQVVKFAPKDIEDNFLGSAYSWVQKQGEDLAGYFTTPTVRGAHNGKTLIIDSNSNGGFSRRQIYPTADTETPTIGDMIMITDIGGTVSLQTKRPMSFSGGSISFGGTAWMGAEPLQQQDNLYSLSMRLGIGMTRATAKWWSMSREIYELSPSAQIQRGWSESPSTFNVPLQGNTLKSTGVMLAFFSSGLSMSIYPSIPVPADTYGYIFIDVVGAHDYTNGNEIESFEIANFEIGYSRDTIDIPQSTSVIRPRELKQERVTSMEYAAVNENDSKEEWNANCIFATDNNMEYGYGLILNPSGGIVEKVQYGYWGEATQEHPEQHLANRVANYWASAKRRIDTELLGHVSQSISGGGSVAISGIQPRHFVTLDGTTFIPIAISRNWSEDIVKLSLLQQ